MLLHIAEFSFFSKTQEEYPTIYIYHIFFIHVSVDRHLCCFCILAKMNNAIMNMSMHIFIQDPDFNYSG